MPLLSETATEHRTERTRALPGPRSTAARTRVAPARRAAVDQSGLLELQRAAGNAAVATMLVPASSVTTGSDLEPATRTQVAEGRRQSADDELAGAVGRAERVDLQRATGTAVRAMLVGASQITTGPDGDATRTVDGSEENSPVERVQRERSQDPQRTPTPAAHGSHSGPPDRAAERRHHHATSIAPSARPVQRRCSGSAHAPRRIMVARLSSPRHRSDHPRGPPQQSTAHPHRLPTPRSSVAHHRRPSNRRSRQGP